MDDIISKAGQLAGSDPQNIERTNSTPYRMTHATFDQQQDAATANTRSYADNINAQYDAAQRQAENTINYQTQQNVNNAQRAYQDSIQGFRSQYKNQTADMYNSMDNAALMARANGQFGGSATAQVGAVQSEYQKQRQALSLQQQKLATDTVREVENLRAQGEFDKADALLKSRQQQFQALYEDAVRVDENRWANERYQTGLDREDAAISREEARYQTGLDREDAAIERERQQYDRSYLQQLGLAFLKMGVMPASNMLEAMGLDKASAQSYINAVLMGY